MPGQEPSLVNTSLWQTPQACTLMRTSPGPGLGISRSTIWKSAPGLGTCAAFIGAIAILVVAMMPPLNFQPWCDDWRSHLVESTMPTPRSCQPTRQMSSPCPGWRGIVPRGCHSRIIFRLGIPSARRSIELLRMLPLLIGIAAGQFAATLGPLRQTGTIPPATESLNQQDGAGQAPAQDIDRGHFIGKGCALRNGH